MLLVMRCGLPGRPGRCGQCTPTPAHAPATATLRCVALPRLAALHLLRLSPRCPAQCKSALRGDHPLIFCIKIAASARLAGESSYQLMSAYRRSGCAAGLRLLRACQQPVRLAPRRLVVRQQLLLRRLRRLRLALQIRRPARRLQPPQARPPVLGLLQSL